MARPAEDATRVQFLRVVALVDPHPERFQSLAPALATTREWRMY